MRQALSLCSLTKGGPLVMVVAPAALSPHLANARGLGLGLDLSPGLATGLGLAKGSRMKKASPTKGTGMRHLTMVESMELLKTR